MGSIGFKTYFFLGTLLLLTWSGRVLGRAETFYEEWKVMKPSREKDLKEIDYWYLKGKEEGETEVKIKCFEKSLNLTETLLQLTPRDPKLLLVWVGNKGEIAQLASQWVALGYLGELREKTELLKTIDPKFYYAAADRILGRLYQLAPGFISYGSNAKAEYHLKEALKLSPQFPGNVIFYADFLFETGKKDEAKKLIRPFVERNEDFSAFPFERLDWTSIIRKISDLR